MTINWQPFLKGSMIELRPLQYPDFEGLYKAASDPLIWEQHPDTFRHKKDIFQKYFHSGLQSKGAFLIIDRSSGEILGSSRFYDYDEPNNRVAIGYTFLVRKCWGKPYNAELKKLMIEYAFLYVDKILFHIGVNNIRSRSALEKLPVTFHSEDDSMSTYELTKERWRKETHIHRTH